MKRLTQELTAARRGAHHSVVFFGWKRAGLAFAEIVLLWLAILATALAFHRLTPAAGLLLLPYLAWVSYAALLNLSIWRLNR